MAKYKVDWMEHKNVRASGKPYISASLVDEAGVNTTDVGIWDNLQTISVGAIIEGSLSTNAKGYVSFKFGIAAYRPPAFGGTPPPSVNTAATPLPASSPSSGRARDDEVREEMRRVGIQNAQKEKEIGMKVAGSMRDATQVLVTFSKELESVPWEDAQAELKERHRKWTDFFMNESERRMKEEREGQAF